MNYLDAGTGDRIDGARCNGNWNVASHSGNEFAGEMWMTGSSPHSDKICTTSGGFTGQVTGDNELSNIRPPGAVAFSNRCTSLSNDGRMSGTINPDGTVTLRTTAQGTCLDGGDRPREVTRSVTLTLTRR